ncbi:MarR family transcriptional regulator [Nocardioides sp. BP30]|uniref:MarR family winged helix-turn-helix transcriptional regulator n=1 Tax=Nocardioides sp. BP30 TaxID=3036374 RepID=UPI002468B131|nr:MarR family transcriptional regulator [Nocardioides sp. BP30]WGL53540.1 MarR family transcriptional regulator [Nocardioides sp. BP30]
MTDLSGEIVLLAGKLIRQLRRDVNMPAAYRVLATLDDLGSAGISQLAAADGISQPTMSTQVAALVQDGYVAKAPHPTDARAQVLSLTDAGRTYLRENRERLAESVRSRLSTHPESDIATAIAVLKSLTEKGNA